MKRRAVVGLAALAAGLASACASAAPARQEVAVAVAVKRSDAVAAAEPTPARSGFVRAVDAAAPARPYPEGPRPVAVRELTPGATYRVGEAVRSGDLVVALLDGRADAGGVEARFLIHNPGPDEAVVSPGNFRLRTDAGRPRMRLGEPPAPLPVGRLGPGETLRGTVSWDAPPGGDVRVVFANGAASVEWALTD